MSRIDKNLDKHQSNNEQDEHKDGDESSEQALLSNKGITDVFIDSQINLVKNTHTQAQIYTYINKYICIYLYTHTHIYIYTYIHIYTHIYIFINK